MIYWRFRSKILVELSYEVGELVNAIERSQMLQFFHTIAKNNLAYPGCYSKTEIIGCQIAKLLPLEEDT